MLKLLFVTSLGFVALTTHAANVTQVNRYATVANKPLAAQINPLLAVQQIHFPQEVKTIGQAVEWWLRYSGFTLVAKEKQPESLQAVMRQPLPQIDRNLGPLTVRDGLEVLVGQQVFTLIEDSLLRQVNFQLKPTVKPRSK
ncbi:TPA: hypothetical protein ACT9LO_002533 [Legionella pneumophila]|nr:hypothetical protein [Legionella pneumophila subsp. pneumophila]HCD9500968.1 hypothetical protein [Legionella pneumophila]